jgi:antitoxin component YwqK of YwqJK toxin-antitoxin module
MIPSKKQSFFFIVLITTVFCSAQEKQMREYYDVNREATVKDISQSQNVGNDEIKTVKTYHGNDCIQISHLKNEKKDGLQLEYYKNGTLKDRTTWKDGNRIGERTSYHPMVIYPDYTITMDMK